MDFEFTYDWTGYLKATLADPAVMAFFEKPVRLLEIGVFEGRSATVFRRHLKPDSTYTGVDPWSHTRQAAGWLANSGPLKDGQSLVEQRARANIQKAYGDMADRTTLIRERSETAWPKLGEFDVIYVDGSHEALAVLHDSDHAWQHLAVGGLVIWDDMQWHARGSHGLGPVGYAVMAFLADLQGPFTIVRQGYQLAASKRG